MAGHDWQKGKLEKLTAQYVYDMQTLIERIGLGIDETEDMSTFIPFLIQTLNLELLLSPGIKRLPPDIQNQLGKNREPHLLFIYIFN
jgi:hypothetical protein